MCLYELLKSISKPTLTGGGMRKYEITNQRQSQTRICAENMAPKNGSGGGVGDEKYEGKIFNIYEICR